MIDHKLFYLVSSLMMLACSTAMAQKAGEVQKWRKSVGLVVSDSSGVVNFGTAFIVDDRGHAVTNYHVIKGAEAVTFYFDRNDPVRAEVIKENPNLDLALLKIEDFQSREHPPLPLYSGKTVCEELTVWVLGFPEVDLISPKSLSEAAARKGNVSKSTEDNIGRKVLQVNASINRGNSGGPVLDACGRVIGVATFKKITGDGETTGFAVSYEELRKFLERFPDVKPTWDKSECSTSALQGMALVVGVIFLAIVLAAIGIIIALKHKEKIASTFSRSLRLPAPKPVAKPIQAPALEPVAAPKPAPAPEPVASQFTLVGTAGPLTGSQFPLSAKALFVGRDPDTSNIVLPPDTQGVSRRHLKYL